MAKNIIIRKHTDTAGSLPIVKMTIHRIFSILDAAKKICALSVQTFMNVLKRTIITSVAKMTIQIIKNRLGGLTHS